MAELGGVPLMDFSMLGQIGQNIKDSRIREQRRSTLESLMTPNGDVDPAALSRGAIGLLRSGDWEGGSNLLNMANSLRKTTNEEAAQRAAMGMLGVGEPQRTAPQMQPTSASGADQPRPLRANNPGAIENGAFAQRQPGYTGTDGRFATFATPQAGMDAHSQLLGSYGQRGINTVAGIVGKWAPANVDNNATAQYTAYVAKRLGVDPNQPLDMLDPRVRSGLAMAMGEFESGPAKFRAAYPQQGQNAAPAPSQPQQTAIPQQPTAQTPAVPQQPAISPQALAIPPGLNPQDDMQARRALAVMSMPGASEGQRAAAKAVYERLTNPSRATDVQRNYGAYVQQETAAGRTPMSMLEYQQALRQQNNVTIASETEYAKKIGDADAAAAVEIQKAGRDAIKARANLDLMGKLIANPNFYSGTAAGLVMSAKRLAASLGIEGADKMAQPSEVFQALANKVVLDGLGGSLGNQISNADRDFIQATAPNLANTPEGNKLLIEVARRTENRKAEVAKLARDYMKRNNGRMDSGFYDQLEQWAEKNPLFGDLPGYGQQPAAPTSQHGAQPAIQEGATATNQQTGQKIIFRGGQWMPAQ